MKKALLFLILFIFSVKVASAQQGCCSWHDGVSHCDSSVGRYMCNDGTYSPSCTCQRDVQLTKVVQKGFNYALYEGLCYSFKNDEYYFSPTATEYSQRLLEVDRLKDRICQKCEVCETCEVCYGCPDEVVIKRESRMDGKIEGIIQGGAIAVVTGFLFGRIVKG